ncbi:hypothetical protein T492DRAFT_840671 [Pavlovales sp. CCMP2436]|nr:hypothetical protein T492DRAFT_840671 [Pavlovales sp. CCMP2436]
MDVQPTDAPPAERERIIMILLPCSRSHSFDDTRQTLEAQTAHFGGADRTYLLPVTREYVEAVIARERPDSIILSMGGQTGLNCGIELDREGVLKKWGVQVLCYN